MGEVVTLDMETTLPIPCDRVLMGAMEAKLIEVVVVGVTEGGDLYFASSTAKAPDILWNLERAKTDLLERVRT